MTFSPGIWQQIQILISLRSYGEMESRPSVETMSDRRYTWAKLILTLLACEILVPRLGFGQGLFTLDDIIPLAAGIMGFILVLRTRRLPKHGMVLLLLAWSFLAFLLQDIIHLIQHNRN